MTKTTPFSRIKSILKYFALSTIAIVLLVFAIIAVVINFVFTPAKLTPVVVEQASKHLRADLSCEEVDLTFFSTFPEFGLRLKNGAIVPHASLSDSAAMANDTLVRFKTILATIQPLVFLTESRIKIGKVLLEEPTIYTHINEAGEPNWDIFIVSDTTTTVVDTVATTNQNLDAVIEIDRIEIRSANLTFRDDQNQLYFDLKELNFALRGSLSKVHNELDISLNTRNILLWKEGQLLVNKVALGLETHLLADLSTHTYDLEKTTLEINGVKIDTNGKLKADTLNKTMDVDLIFGLKVPSLKTILDLVPTSLVKEAVDIKADGAVQLNGTMKGLYGKESMPVLNVAAKIENGNVHYKGMPYGVDRLDLDLNSCIDLSGKEPSYIDLHHFFFKGASTEISLSGKVLEPHTNPKVTANVNAEVNFTELAKTFPLEEGVTLEGILSTKLSGDILVADIHQENWGKLLLNGYVKAENLAIVSEADTFKLKVQRAGLKFGSNLEDSSMMQGTNLLNALIGFDGMRVETRIGWAEMDQTALHVKTSPLKDTTAIASVNATLGFSRINLLLQDTVGLRSGAAKVNLQLSPSPKNKQIPVIASELVFDSLFVHAGEHRASLREAGFNLRSEKSATQEKHWQSTGSVGFAHLQLFSPAFPLLIQMPASKISIEEDRILLNRAAVTVGSSDMTLTGKLENLTETFFSAGKLIGNLQLSADYIDCNQIMRALEQHTASDTIPSLENPATQSNLLSEKTTEEGKSGIFVIPNNVDFTLSTQIKQVKFSDMLIENIIGDIIVRNQCIELSKLKMHTLAADMETTLVYKATDSESAYTGFDLSMKEIQVGRLVDFMPSLDTLVPMLRSLDGLVNFHIAAETQLDKSMMPIIPTLQAASRVRGDSLVLMDGETFSEISKMLRFKNKQRNVIDSVSVDLMVRNGQIEIYPFLIRMDRYLVAVGGRHNIDMTFDYHVSLIDSPIPFKIGVDIKGDLDNFKYRITKPKYKSIHQSTRISPVDSTGITVRQRIYKTLQEGAQLEPLTIPEFTPDNVETEEE